MSESKKNSTTVTINTQNLVATTAVVTSTVIVTTFAWKVVGEAAAKPLAALTNRLKKENEKNNK
jgi:hypothetical protein